MTKKIVIIGAGFAGVWSALSAKRLLDLRSQNQGIEILVIAPEPSLVIRPRLYEANASDMTHPLGALFEGARIEFLQGMVRSINYNAQTLDVRSWKRRYPAKEYPGIQQHTFDIDSLESATKLETHLRDLASLPPSPGRNTIVVCGGGFTGIELATELPKRLGHISDYRVVLVENTDQIGLALGPGPRPVITQALEDLGIEVKAGSPVAKLTPMAFLLLLQFPAPKDELSRLHVDQYLRIPTIENAFATGDAASALADTKGHYALMSCQHALQLGRVSGHNAAADLLGEPMIEYSQAAYNCCLDLGSWGAVISAGWDRKVKHTGDVAKRVKCYINQQLIYPPHDSQEALTLANPNWPDSDQLFEQMLQAVG
ncbi:hypothetical protein N7509_006477 [Penicillium cosmopolitanum]|uniref:FAD/NAD(P)-binding domain-containing protein n=1 Tax=Penicillium cosmopolitanum TaxID=1131564 RepID=A0A9W9W089_9EURO|nr:uncharacterized protein N7509_006477 [Penicillium cosmopolitanum]KAJ5394690.1 hypothetical protein N7509_006477 [Penicillium cosmopolitanum]